MDPPLTCNYRPQRSCEGYVFTPVCQSFCSQGRGGLPQCMLGYHTPQEQTPLWDQAPSGTRHPLGTRHPPGQGTTPPGPGTPWDQASSQDQVPPGTRCAPPRTRHRPQQTATVADGTHPTGMHSC